MKNTEKGREWSFKNKKKEKRVYGYKKRKKGNLDLKKK